ncbi:hypothetical protein MTP99_015602 [Tenebrio molitor]|nr:hypothetical protein MTP99_015602 [Tenebrio molitor]
MPSARTPPVALLLAALGRSVTVAPSPNLLFLPPVGITTPDDGTGRDRTTHYAATTNCTVGTCLFTTRVIGTKAFAKCSLFWGPRAGFAPHPLSHDKCAAPLCATPETIRPKVEVPRK